MFIIIQASCSGAWANLASSSGAYQTCRKQRSCCVGLTCLEKWSKHWLAKLDWAGCLSSIAARMMAGWKKSAWHGTNRRSSQLTTWVFLWIPNTLTMCRRPLPWSSWRPWKNDKKCRVKGLYLVSMQFLVQIPNQQAKRKLKLDWDYFALISLWNLCPRRTGKPASIAWVMSGPTRHNLRRVRMLRWTCQPIAWSSWRCKLTRGSKAGKNSSSNYHRTCERCTAKMLCMALSGVVWSLNLMRSS